MKTCMLCARKKLAELVQGGWKRLDIRVDPPRRDPRKKGAGTR